MNLNGVCKFVMLIKEHEDTPITKIFVFDLRFKIYFTPVYLIDKT